MVLGYHVIFSAYGFWLPNDPRGSWSEWVGAWELFRFGTATKVATARSVANVHHDHGARREAKQSLHYPAVSFTGVQAQQIGIAFGIQAKKSDFTIWACAILPEHVHMVIGRHHYKVEQIVNLLKGAATKRLIEKKLHPLASFTSNHERVATCWARKVWKVFLDSDEDILRSNAYVERNPEKEGRRRQTWKFVSPYVR